jgi:hypothetical protein
MTVASPHVNTDIGSVGLIVGSGGRRFSGLYPPLASYLVTATPAANPTAASHQSALRRSPKLG